MIHSNRQSECAVLLLGLLLVVGLACKRPETALRERPAQRIELIQTVQGMTPEEEKALVAQLAEGLGLPPESPEQVAGPYRVFRLTLKGKPSHEVGWGLGKTWLISTGTGALTGLLLPVIGYTFWATTKSAVTATAVGGVLGFAYGPTWFTNNQSLAKKLGYFPWTFSATWEVLERRPGGVEEVIASSARPAVHPTTVLDLKPYLKPLPLETPSEADVRQASLRAYAEALVRHFRKKG